MLLTNFAARMQLRSATASGSSALPVARPRAALLLIRGALTFSDARNDDTHAFAKLKNALPNSAPKLAAPDVTVRIQRRAH